MVQEPQEDLKIYFSIEGVLSVLGHAILGWLHRQIYKEFRAYMLTTYYHVWLDLLLDLRTAKSSQYGVLGFFGRSVGLQLALDLYPGQFMRDVVEGRQALVNYMSSTFFM